MPPLGRSQPGWMALAIACLLWLAAFTAAGVTASDQPASVVSAAPMQLHGASDQGLANSVSLPPAAHWRLGVEQGRWLEGANHPHFDQMLLAWFQHDILGLLCGLLFFLPLIYLRQLSSYLGDLHKRLLFGQHLQFRFCHGDSCPACC